METLPVTLIVKAPNQQIEDQTVKCELSWTIQKLKQHLSEVYPSKPPKHEQKLIYSGQLLGDSLTLKDVLRQYEGQETHTVHLVCSTKYSQTKEAPPPATSTSNNTTSTSNSSTTQFQPPPPNTNNTQNEQNIPNINPLPNMPWLDGAPPVTPMDANQYAMQMAWMQQAYYQYMTQYMQLAASSYGATPFPTQPNVGDAGAQPQPNAVPEQPAPAADVADGVRDPDNPERDWLDIFYLLSRLLVLFSVVYFYSSPIRFIFVLIFAIGLYLYQIGFFRNINNNNNNNNTRDPVEVEEEQAPSRLMIVWTFFATFFASLIPEIPNAV